MKISHIPRKSYFTYFKFFIIISVIITSSLSLQAQWIRLNSGVSSQLISVYFVNQNTGFACGSDGKVLKTTNAGLNWQANTVSDTASLTSVFFINSNTGFIAGRVLLFQPVVAEPVLLETTNGGGTWNSVLTDSGYTLWSVCFINENTGFATGGLYASGPNKLLTTTNGGTSWQIGSFAEPGYLESVSFNNISTGYAVSFGGSVYKTGNSGQNWSLISQIPKFLVSIAFLSPDIGITTGFDLLDSTGYIYKTSNGGGNWVTVYSDNMGMLNSIRFVNSNTGFAAGHCEGQIYSLSARIVKTTNSGANWYIDTLFSNIGGLGSLFFTDENTGYAVGSDGAIFKTTTGGNTVGIENNTGEVPGSFYLYQNYPNPFNPNTNIKYQIPKSSIVKLNIYNVQGKDIKTLVNSFRKAGIYDLSFDGSNLPSGIYFYRLEAENYIQTRKMVLVK